MRFGVTVPTEAAMAELGADLARTLRAGDRVALLGDLGAGKTTLARAILRTLADDPSLEVPSPSFTLVQNYDELDPPVRHVDLYRVEGPEAVAELGLGERQGQGDSGEHPAPPVELVEWAREPMPITIAIGFPAGGGEDEERRHVALAADAAWLARLSRERAATRFVAQAGWAASSRTPIVQDASTRNYQRVSASHRTAVLMDAPVFALEPGSYPVRAGLHHGDLNAFLAIGAVVAARGLRVPTIYAADREAGFLLLEDFGSETIAPGGVAEPERYAAAVDALAAFHAEPVTLPLPVDPPHTPAVFDTTLALVEVSQYCEWALGIAPPAEFGAAWASAIDSLPRHDDTLALRDVHSPNLLWLSGADDIAKVGFIDYQDAMIAPAAYDVASLLQDARVDVPPTLEAELLARYVAARPGLDRSAFLRSYRILGAQRITKILGIFQRLAKRDGKPRYLAHLPRLERALAGNLAAEPALAELARWFAKHTDLSVAA